MKISNKISLVFLIFTTLLIVIASSVFYLVAKDNLRNAIYGQLEADVEENSRHIETYLELLKVSIAQLSKSVVLEAFLKAGKENPQARQTAFDVAMKRLIRTKEANSEVYEFMLLDVDGRVIASSNKESVGLDRSADAFFIGGQNSIFIKDAYYSEVAKKNLITVSGPVLNSDTNEFLGVLAARIRMVGLNNITEGSTNRSKSRELYIVNKYGYMITPSRFLKNSFLKQRVDTDNFRDCLLHRHQTVEYDNRQERPDIALNYRGQRVLGAHAYIPEMQWCVLSEIDEKEALAPLAQIRLIFIFILLFVPSLAYLLGKYFAAIIVKPIDNLCRGMEIIGKGDLKHKVGTNVKDEIGQLSRIFDDMAVNLQKSTTSIDDLKQEISLRRKMEEVLNKSEERYRILYTESRDAVLVLSPERGFLSGNPAAVKLFRCKSEKDFRSMNTANLSPEYQPDGSKSADLAQQMIMLAIANGAHKFEWTFRRLDSEDFEATVLFSKFELDKKVLLQATVRDVTEQKSAQLALEKSQIWFSTTLNSIGDAVITIDLAAKITFINPVAQKLTGWSKAEAIGRHIDEVFVIKKASTDQKAENPVLKVLSNGQIFKLAHSTVLVAKDGSRCAIDDSAAPIRGLDNQEVMGVVLVFRDVTERYKIEQELRELSIAVQQSPASVVITDKDGEMQYVNPKFVQVTGYSIQEALGQNPRILKSGEHSSEFYKNLWETIIAGREWRGEFHNKKKNGQLYWEGASISPIRNDEGKIVNFIAIREDITERKEMLEELKQKNIELEKLDQLKSDFVSIVSHELRTPLSITKEGINLVLDGVTGSINPKQNKILTTSKNNIDRLARIINSLLDISKIESGRIELNKKNVNLEVLIKNVVSAFESQAKEKGLELKVDLPQDQEPNLFIDEDRIIQVFTNLIGNAIKFTEKGSVSISLVQKKNELEFIISDTGIGIAADDLPNVFSKFLQFGRSAGGSGEKGTGLGLSIARSLIELHRGQIRVESELAKGTKFIFSLPKYSADQNAREHVEDAINDVIKANTNLALIIATLNYSDKLKAGVPSGILLALEENIRAQLRKNKDQVLRYQNEFIIILRDCNKNSALITQGRIEQALRTYLSGINFNNDVRVVFGCAVYPEEASNYQELIDKSRLT